MKFKGLSALVTGSLRGIGLPILISLAKEGCDVVINDIKPEREAVDVLQQVQTTYGVRSMYCPADVSKPEQVRGMVKTIESTFGKLDILVNNAGIQYTARTEQFPDEMWEAILAIDLSASFYLIKAVLPGMQKRDFGRIINIASAHSLVASANKAAYVSAKHGLLGLTKVVGIENAHQNITCNAVCPGFVDTPLVRAQILQRATENLTSVKEEEIKLLSEKHPNARFVSTEAIARAVLYFADPENRHSTSTHLSVDGGWTSW